MLCMCVDINIFKGKNWIQDNRVGICVCVYGQIYLHSNKLFGQVTLVGAALSFTGAFGSLHI